MTSRALKMLRWGLVLCVIGACGDTSDDGQADAGDAAAGDASTSDGPIPDDCITDVSAGTQQLECEGLTFDLSVPPECTERACGLIVDVHGFGMNGAMQANHSGLRELGAEHGYILVHPWAPGAPLTSMWNPSHDAPVMAFMQRVIAAFDVDADRIHMAGYSQGGFMTWRFLCKYSDLLASVAPLAAGSPRDSGNGMGCDIEVTPPEHERPVLYMHGTTDGLVLFEGAMVQHAALIELWSLEQTEVVATDDEHEWTRFVNARGTTYEFVQHEWECGFTLRDTPLRGHCFPGSGMLLGCGEDTAFHWGQAVMQFFLDHPKADR